MTTWKPIGFFIVSQGKAIVVERKATTSRGDFNMGENQMNDEQRDPEIQRIHDLFFKKLYEAEERESDMDKIKAGIFEEGAKIVEQRINELKREAKEKDE